VQRMEVIHVLRHTNFASAVDGSSPHERQAVRLDEQAREAAISALLAQFPLCIAHRHRKKRARRALEQAWKPPARVRQLDPALRVSNLRDRMGPYRRPEDVARYEEGLRKAGLPE